jgi:hypothetical protein
MGPEQICQTLSGKSELTLPDEKSLAAEIEKTRAMLKDRIDQVGCMAKERRAGYGVKRKRK